MRVVRDLRPGAPPRGASSPSLNDENRAANMKTVNLNAAYFPAVELLSALVTAGILLYGGLQAIEGDVTVGVLVAFIAALNNFFDPIQQLSQLYTTYQAGMAALDKIFELLDEEPDLRDRPGRARAAAAARRAALRPRLVRLRAGRRERARRTSTCTCPPGRRSRSSARPAPGKSTFAKLAARFYDPTEGRDPASTGTTCATCRRARCARRWGSCPRRRSCSAGRSSTTSPSGGRTRPSTRSRTPRARSARTTSSRRSSTATRPRSASAGSSSRPASASSSRSRAR